MKDTIIAPSILSADFSKLGREARRMEAAGADWLHIDVMDGHFVPNITIGAPVIRSLRRQTGLVLDSHLMIENPQNYLDDFIKAGSDIITIHAEACRRPAPLVRYIKSKGLRAGISLRPKTPASRIKGLLGIVDMVLVMTVEPGFGGQKFMERMVPKIKNIRRMFEGDIQVDGGIDARHAKKAKAAGANVLVAGTYIFYSKNARKAIQSLR